MPLFDIIFKKLFGLIFCARSMYFEMSGCKAISVLHSGIVFSEMVDVWGLFCYRPFSGEWWAWMIATGTFLACSFRLVNVFIFYLITTRTAWK